MDEPVQDNGSAGDRSAEMYSSIVSAVVEHRLAPGTRLREERLAELFQVSRTQVRPVLQRLEHEGLVERQPRRGAVVASPDREATAQIFAARRLVEPWLVRCVCAQGDRGALRKLARVVRDEDKARAADDHRAVVRLSGDFHRVLAAQAGNQPLADLMQTLTVRTCLAIVANRASTGSTCREDEHAQIVQAMTDGDAARAARLMTEHLDHIERSLDAMRLPAPADDLGTLLPTTPAQPPARKMLRSRS
ncbi:MAG: GntR family transcriptional regulator [Burkholderiaceae bacterium]|jgi:DNA-binding GntR family transcriptional regulator|nr:GntR family transcriptional regulator [Burkholderiaceae bacterium]MCU0937571.1 GntR family transcriptional regulator [Burkholderiaceae bacterium]